jgi:transcriptional regulator with XRE-family HTH domain
MTTEAKIRRFLAKGVSADEIAKKLGISKNRVYTVRWKEAKKTVKPKKAKPTELKREAVLTDDEIIALFDRPKPDLVNHPEHYKAGGIETIDFIESKDLNYRLGNVVKYISRAGKKDSDPVQDLEKAAWYLKREIEARKGA